MPVAALHATSGAIERVSALRGRVTTPSFRAEVDGAQQDVELTFVYEGASTETARLASGELRRQLGLKLLSYNSCNVSYVMWRFEPRPALHVSQKINPGKTRHAECGDAGYREVAARDLPVVKPGEEHRLNALLAGNALRVLIDGKLVWRGQLPVAARPGERPQLGIRADNAVFQFSLSTLL